MSTLLPKLTVNKVLLVSDIGKPTAKIRRTKDGYEALIRRGTEQYLNDDPVAQALLADADFSDMDHLLGRKWSQEAPPPISLKDVESVSEWMDYARRLQLGENYRDVLEA